MVATEKESKTKSIVLHPCVNYKVYQVEEACSLAEAAGLLVAITRVVKIRKYSPATLIGKGVVEELRGQIAAEEIPIVFINSAVSPIQQRNLERTWKCKVFDRSSLIIEIFAQRARTAEGRLQVELASLEYQKSRLVRAWTHLERQRGGFGFMAGPGETQLEIDKRLIVNRIHKIKKDLDKVKNTRSLHRKARRKVPYPIVSLVGYTNAGKSSIFNKLTKSQVFVQDMLFATLDPTLRIIKLPSGKSVILSDTVGFISNLPTQLIAAFRATLEEVIEADVLLHVVDISHSYYEEQTHDVLFILKEIGVSEEKPIIEVRNKIDKLENQYFQNSNKTVFTSALTEFGISDLFNSIDDALMCFSERISLP